MASEYFGLKGNLVKRYQEILRALGADIKVNGKWGKKTELAFNQYRDQFLEKIGQKPAESVNPYQMLEAQGSSDEEKRGRAENLYGAKYDGELENLDRSARDQREAKEAELGRAEEEYAGQLDSLGRQYEKQRQALQTAALSRGLGRSSYVTDQIAGSQKRENEDAAALGQSAQKRKEEIGQAISRLNADTQATRGRLLSERENQILSAIDRYREEERSRADEAARYNNQMLSQYRQESENTRQFEAELQNALELARMRKK